MRAALALTLALSFGCAATASAQNVGFLRNSVMESITRDDAALLEKNYKDALEQPDGHTSTWTNPRTGHSGTATPLRATKVKDMSCRVLEMSNTAGGRTERSELTFCKTKDGWRLV